MGRNRERCEGGEGVGCEGLAILTQVHAGIKGEHIAAKRVTDFFIKTPVVVDSVTSKQENVTQI